MSIINGTPEDDSLDGGVEADEIYGLGGNDTLTGLAGDDLLDGGDDADNLDGGTGNDTLVGGGGADFFQGYLGDDSLVGGEGDDALFDESGSNVFEGGDGNDVIQVHSTALASGGSGQDVYYIFANNLFGWDFVVDDFAEGADGDQIRVMNLLTYNDGQNINTYAGGNPFDPELGFLRLYQADGDTWLQWDRDGAAGDDHEWVTQLMLQDVLASSITVDNIYEGIDPLGGSITGESIDGTSGGDLLEGGFFDDTINGLGGNDEVNGRGGNDLLDGGPDNDLLRDTGGNDTLHGGDGNDYFLVFDNLYGGDADDYYYGGAGNDTIQFDGFGDNVMDGGDGDDLFMTHATDWGASAMLTGGAGRDTYRVYATLEDRAFEVTDFAAGAGGDFFDVEPTLTYSAQYEHYTSGNPFDAEIGILRLLEDTLSGATHLQYDFDGAAGLAHDWVTSVTLQGTPAASITSDNFLGNLDPGGGPIPPQVINGTPEDDSLDGGFGVDEIYGFGGNDTLTGLAGDDLLDGGDDADNLDGGTGNDTLVGGGGADFFQGYLGDDSLVGGEGDDALFDESGSNVFEGGDGNDVIQVHSTALASGGSGQDVYYIFANNLFGWDFVVDDFAEGADGDQIRVMNLLTYNDGQNINTYAGGNPFDPELGFLRLYQADGDTWLQWDRDGAAGDDHEWVTQLMLQDVLASSITVDNIYEGIDPLGGSITGESIDGTSGGDLLEGGFFDDTINGLGGNDEVNGRGGNDLLDGGPDNDLLRDTGGNDTLHGGDGNDYFLVFDNLYGGDADDYYYGGAGNDTIQFDGFGDNVMDGGDGDDLFMTHATDWGASAMLTGGAGRDTYRVYATLEDRAFEVTDFAAGAGGDFFDVEPTLTYSAQYEHYTSGNPFDAEIGILRLLEDTLSGATHLQYDFDGAAGLAHDWVTSVTLQGTPAASITSDNFLGRLIVGTANADDLVGGFFDDTIQGLAGNDTLDGAEGGDSMEGGSGNDLYYVDDAGDEVIESDNNVPGGLLLPGWGPGAPHSVLAATLLDGISDTVIAAVNFSLENLDYVEIVTLEGDATQATGNSLANALNGNALANALFALDGEDTVNGGDGNDTLDGGAGADVLYGNLNDDSLAGGLDDDTLYGGQHNDTVGGGDGNDNGQGNFGDDSLAGEAGNDTLHGGQGNDRFNGGAGDDSLVGGLGNDTADYSAAAGAITVDLLGGTASGELGSDTLSGMEGVTGGAGGDTLSGGLANDTLVGGAGNDSVSGGEANDYVYGNLNDDTVSGGAGDDSLYGGQQNDVADGGDGADRIEGNFGDDTLTGGVGNDAFVHGGQGNDWVYGNTGDDTLFGGLGNDQVFGGQQNDVLSGGDGDDNEQGNLGDDVMAGDAGNDTLHGGQGNDTLAGNAGNDSLVGGLGNDLFRYDATSLNTGDVGANQADIIGATAGDLLSMLGLNDEITINGTALSALTANLAVGNVLNATNNIAFSGGVLQIDLDNNDVFNALNDFQVAISGVTTVTYNATNDFFNLA